MCVCVCVFPNAPPHLLKVSASIMEYATFAAPVLKVHAAAGSQEVLDPTDSDQQER